MLAIDGSLLYDTPRRYMPAKANPKSSLCHAAAHADIKRERHGPLLQKHFSSKGIPTKALKCVPNVFCTMQLLMLTSSEKVMGRCFKNTLLTNIAAWVIAAAVLAINGFLLFDFVAKDLPTNAAARLGFLFCVAIYLVLVIYFGIGPER